MKRKVIVCVVCFVLPLVTLAVCFVKDIQFNQRCAGFLKQAADANSVELAERQLSLAIDYIEKNGLTSGYTSVIYKTEDENIGFWYENLKTCQKELAETKDNSTLENTNVLMKLRESLTDESEKGTKLTIPPGLYLYPHNAVFMVVGSISFVMFLISLVMIAWIWADIKAEYDDDDDDDDDDEED